MTVYCYFGLDSMSSLKANREITTVVATVIITVTTAMKITVAALTTCLC